MKFLRRERTATGLNSGRHAIWLALNVFVCCLAMPIVAWAGEDFVGKFQNDKLGVEITADTVGAFRGTIHLGTNDFPLQARLQGSQLEGTFESQGFQYAFTAILKGNELSLASGGKTYVLSRLNLPPPNPLAAEPAQPANPLESPMVQTNRAPPPADRPGPETPEGYTLLAAQGVGRTFFVFKPGTRSAREAVLGALRDLKSAFGDKPVVSGTFGDTGDKRCHSSFTVRLKDQAFKGFAAAGTANKGAAVTIVCAAADASPAQVAALMSALPVPARWDSHQLPAGSGAIMIPAEWKITQSTPLGTVMVSGPSNQVVGLGVGAEVVDPSSNLATQPQRSGTMLVASFSDPVTALKTLVPQLSEISQRQGGPAIKLERIISASPAPTEVPNGQAAWLTSSYLKGSGGTAYLVREVALLECYPVSAQGWGFYTSFISGPESSFERDVPIMVQIAHSWRLNESVVMDNARQMVQTQNRTFAALQESLKEYSQVIDSYMTSLRNTQQVRDKCNADFDEVVRGYRMVEDVLMGNRKDMALTYSRDIVEKLNQREGIMRYKEVTLREQ